MSPLTLAVVLAVASSAAYAAAAVLQERVAARLRSPDRRTNPPAFLFLSRFRWWIALGLNGAGGALHVAALAYGPLSVIQPMGVLTLVLALPLGAAIAGHWSGAGRWWGGTLTTAGLALFLLLTVPGAATTALDAGAATLVAAVSTVLVAGLALAARAFGRAPMVRGLLAAVAAGTAFAVASALTQTVARGVLDGGTVALLSPLSPALAGMAVAGLLLSQFAYRDSGLGAPLAALTLANPVASVVIAMSLLDQRPAGGGWGIAAATAGAALAAAGVLLLSAPERAAPPPAAAGRPVPVTESPTRRCATPR